MGDRAKPEDPLHLRHLLQHRLPAATMDHGEEVVGPVRQTAGPAVAEGHKGMVPIRAPRSSTILSGMSQTTMALAR